ncbi:hypothetical protein [Sphingobium sp. KCTC 72723]|uniref:hypothetical protein n=1 Tax=Sphingobium sp. KCTC 72723 TaxID=2733867 RepID=UPI001CB6B912|nr:hypothetical protein [Sphingobium sp. KCTC 72723]
MSTNEIEQLIASGVIERYDPELEAHVLEARTIYMFKKVRDQIADRVQHAASDRQLETSPMEQLDAVFTDFCDGTELYTSEQFKCLNPKSKGVWEIKTPDVRMFGWFYLKDVFIATSVDTKHRILEHNLYTGYINEASDLRIKFFGDEAEYISGTEPDNVISNWS